MSITSAKRGFPLIQALRAGAALSVAFTHILYQALQLNPDSSVLHHLDAAMPWGAGVDVFFVISGFVIVYSSRHLFAQRGAPRIFLARRLSRIVPLYWATTTLFLLEFYLLPGSIHGAVGGPGFIAKSYAFIPAMRPDGLVQPAFGLGWTLNYEMFFYLVFAPFLLLRQQAAVPATSACLTLFVLAGWFIGFHSVVLRFWSSPIILEFCVGMGLAFLPGKLTLPTGLRILLVIAALAALHWHPQDGPGRFYLWGIPAAVLVLAASTGKMVTRLPALERQLVFLGDASYALYLVHPFVMRAVALIWQRLHAGAVLYAVLCLVLAEAASLGVHHYGERPATKWLRAKFERDRI